MQLWIFTFVGSYIFNCLNVTHVSYLYCCARKIYLSSDPMWFVKPRRVQFLLKKKHHRRRKQQNGMHWLWFNPIAPMYGKFTIIYVDLVDFHHRFVGKYTKPRNDNPNNISGQDFLWTKNPPGSGITSNFRWFSGRILWQAGWWRSDFSSFQILSAWNFKDRHLNLAKSWDSSVPVLLLVPF